MAGKSALNRSGLSAAGASPGKARKIAAGFGAPDRLMTDLFIERHAEPPEEAVADGSRFRAARRPGGAALSRLLR